MMNIRSRHRDYSESHEAIENGIIYVRTEFLSYYYNEKKLHHVVWEQYNEKTKRLKVVAPSKHNELEKKFQVQRRKRKLFK